MKTLLCLLALASVPCLVQADTLVAFTPEGFTNGGPSPWTEDSAPNTIALHENVRLEQGLERGEGVNPSGTAQAWGGSGWDTKSKEEAAAAADFFTFTVKPEEGCTLDLTQLSTMLFRGENSATTYQWQYRIAGGEFVDLGPPVTVLTDSVKGISQDPVEMTSVAALQGVSEPVTFRMLGWGATTRGSSWGFGKTNGSPVLILEGTVTKR